MAQSDCAVPHLKKHCITPILICCLSFNS